MSDKRRASVAIADGITESKFLGDFIRSRLKKDPLDGAVIQRIKSSTNLSEGEINLRHETFQKQFPDGGITVRAFRKLSACVVDQKEVRDFTISVFEIFDGDRNKYLTFEEFTLATEVHETTEKLAWLFDNVYDKVINKKNQSTTNYPLNIRLGAHYMG